MYLFKIKIPKINILFIYIFFLFKTSKDQTIEELRVEYEISEVAFITEQPTTPTNLGSSVMSILFEKKNQTVSTLRKMNLQNIYMKILYLHLRNMILLNGGGLIKFNIHD